MLVNIKFINMNNKFLNILQKGLALIYLLGTLYLIILNWKIFKSPDEINYGLNTWNASLSLIFFLWGLITILLIWLISYIKDLRHEMKFMKREEEIRNIKHSQHLNTDPPEDSPEEEEDYI